MAFTRPGGETCHRGCAGQGVRNCFDTAGPHRWLQLGEESTGGTVVEGKRAGAGTTHP